MEHPGEPHFVDLPQAFLNKIYGILGSFDEEFRVHVLDHLNRLDSYPVQRVVEDLSPDHKVMDILVFGGQWYAHEGVEEGMDAV